MASIGNILVAIVTAVWYLRSRNYGITLGNFPDNVQPRVVSMANNRNSKVPTRFTLHNFAAISETTKMSMSSVHIVSIHVQHV